LTSDPDIQTRPIEGPSTSSMWIWHKTVQRLSRYVIHKQTETSQKAPKTEPYAVHCVR